ncbi:MAG: DEAD/DEAH box helicase [Clostridiales bacterium]|nr:DEAD/DEAH box helicase [Clostridiales bacterium]
MHITDEMIKKLCSDMVYRHGDEIFTDGRVHIKKRSDTEIGAAVDGEELYHVYISFEDNKIKSELCTCTYYQTMQTPCKHIVAVLMQRMAELKDGANLENENDRIASLLCHEFSYYGERQKIRATFELFVRPNRDTEPEFEMSVVLPDCGGRIQGLENFLDCYLNYKEFRVDRSNVYSRRSMYFAPDEDNIIKILAEVYQTRSSGISLYRKASSKTSFGSAVIRRVLPYLTNMDFKFVFDGISISGVKIKQDDPDILIDILATGRDIMMSLSESGYALTPNGEWFFYNDNIYHTSHTWRDYFMPIYRSLSDERRTQITFKGDNAMLFAAHVLPKLRDRHGVVIDGVDEIIVNDKPEFTVFLDSDGKDIVASVTARYGSMQFRLPQTHIPLDDKIIIRDFDFENRVLSMFGSFNRTGYVYRLSGDNEIYKFITQDIKLLSGLAKVVVSDSFRRLEINDNLDLSVKASYNTREDYLEIEFSSNLLPEEISELLNALKFKEDFYRTKDGRYIEFNNNSKRELIELLLNVGVTEEDLKNGRKILPKFELLRLEASNDIEKDRSIKEYIDAVRSKKIDIPNKLANTLRGYQKDAISWFYELTQLGMGGILADDMGLGKTLETIAYIHCIKPDKPTLIVAPSTLIYNWQREIERFLPDSKYLLINGAKDERTELIQKVGEYEFVITSYPLLRRDINQYKYIEFSFCVIDEAQYIKNRKTMNAISVKKIQAKHKFALTGTPIENSIMELWSIFDFIMPGYLGTARSFGERFLNVSDDAEISETLRNIIRPFVLRRLKKDVLSELPEKIETTMTAELSREQKAIYQVYVEKVRNEAIDVLASGGGKMGILTGILRLRQICCHPELFVSGQKLTSGKLELLKDVVKTALAGGHRILIFSQFRKMLDIIENELAQQGISAFTITGDVPIQERVDICERFNCGEKKVILVSLKAGGTGINLTGADTVIHYDPWWNPAVTDQATDRAYRIGQTRAVQVIKLASHGTIEEKILRLESKKRALADDIIKVNSKTIGNLTDREIMSLFDI